MLSRLSSTYVRTSIFNLVCSSFPSSFYFSVFLTNSNSSHNLKSPLISALKLGNLNNFNFSYLFAHQFHNFPTVTVTSSLKELLLNISYLSPQTCRKFLRVSCWKPEHVLEILLGFQLGVGNSKIGVQVVENLWEFFIRVDDDDRNVGFKHLGQSCEVMASMLINVGMLREVEILLSESESQGILPANDEIFSGLIEGYVNLGVMERALLMYDAMRKLSLVPSLSCYRSLLSLSLEEGRVGEAIQIFEDLIDVDYEFGDIEAKNVESLIGILCRDAKIRDARRLLKRIVSSGWKPNTLVISEVAHLYCEKKDFEDLLGFFIEMKCTPDILVANKIINSLCSNFGVGRAISFLRKLENLGFTPNEITFGIFISWCCLDGKLRNAFVYLSEILSRGMKPDRRSYNALISGLFKAGVQEHAGEILREMVDNGIKPNMATYRALLAGYSKARRFNDVKLMTSEMVDHGFIQLSPLENPISKAFAVLGLNPLTVKLKRDNDIKNFRTEYVDSLGNGLYLDTNVDEFEKTVMDVLEESLIPDFNLLMMKQCDRKNVKGALVMLNEMLQWGQESSLPVLSGLVRLICESDRHIKTIPILLHKVFHLFSKLDHEILNLLVEALGKKGFVKQCKLVLHEMYRRHVPIFNATHTAALVALCKLGSNCDILHCWGRARENNWSPDWDDFIIILESLGRRNLLKEMLDLEERRNQLYDDGYNNRMPGFSVGKDMPRTRNVLNDMIVKCATWSNPGLRAMMGYFYRNGQVQYALQLINQIKSTGCVHFSTSHYAIVDCCFSEGKIQCMEKGLALETNDFNNVIQNFCRDGKLEQAVELLDQSLKKGIIPDASSYDFVVQSFCAYNNVECALDFFYEMLHRGIKPCIGTWDILIQKFCKFGQTKEAESVLISMIEVGQTPTKEMYCSVIERYRMENNLSKASELLNRMQRQGYEPNFVTQWSLISSLSNSNDQKSENGTEGFLSKLLVESGFPSESPKSKPK